MWLKRGRIALDEPIERAPDRHFAALTPDIAGHRAVDRTADPCGIERTEQIAAVAIPHISFTPRSFAQPPYHFTPNPRCPVSAAHEPDRVKCRIIRHLDKGVGSLCIGSSEMSGFIKALFVEDQFGLAMALLGERGDPGCILAGERG